MNREEQLTKSMLDMANGAIKERVDIEMPKIIKNILKNYDPNISYGVHTVRFTLMQWDYVGHI